jgi:2-polyprenyl-6-methoxyphenol hydroxylase-like FAD-dependent oxidoreductase
MDPILVLGGGIAGTVAALALRKAGLAAVVYEAREPDEENGYFLNLAPNGLAVLEALGVRAEVEAAGFPFLGMDFFNAGGKPIGTVQGSPSLVVKRAALHRALWDAAVRRGVRFEVGRRLVEARPEGVAGFADGSEARGVLLGCDGIHSVTRRTAFPEAPPPRYTGLLGVGGFARADVDAPVGRMQMTFGARAFFGWVKAPGGEIFWFSNLPCPEDPDRDVILGTSPAEWRRRVADLHAGDADPIGAVVAATGDSIGCRPIHDIPSLPAWRRGRVCLVGDAAHATSPHAGQGASMAMEDAFLLARCLRDASDPEVAFAAYESLRRDRVERLVAWANRIGNQKAPTGAIQLWFRDLLMPLFLRLGQRADAWVHDYRVAW